MAPVRKVTRQTPAIDGAEEGGEKKGDKQEVEGAKEVEGEEESEKLPPGVVDGMLQGEHGRCVSCHEDVLDEIQEAKQRVQALRQRAAELAAATAVHLVPSANMLGGEDGAAFKQGGEDTVAKSDGALLDKAKRDELAGEGAGEKAEGLVEQEAKFTTLGTGVDAGEEFAARAVEAEQRSASHNVEAGEGTVQRTGDELGVAELGVAEQGVAEQGVAEQTGGAQEDAFMQDADVKGGSKEDEDMIGKGALLQEAGGGENLPGEAKGEEVSFVSEAAVGGDVPHQGVRGTEAQGHAEGKGAESAVDEPQGEAVEGNLREKSDTKLDTLSTGNEAATRAAGVSTGDLASGQGNASLEHPGKASSEPAEQTLLEPTEREDASSVPAEKQEALLVGTAEDAIAALAAAEEEVVVAESQVLECDVCEEGFHLPCVEPAVRAPPRRYVCQNCVKCRSCGATTAGPRPACKWQYGYTMCVSCGRQFARGNFCPVCLHVYRSTDLTPMVECDRCRAWVHIACDGISEKRYERFNANDNLRYVCGVCTGKRRPVDRDGDVLAAILETDGVDSRAVEREREAAERAAEEEREKAKAAAEDTILEGGRTRKRRAEVAGLLAAEGQEPMGRHGAGEGTGAHWEVVRHSVVGGDENGAEAEPKKKRRGRPPRSEVARREAQAATAAALSAGVKGEEGLGRDARVKNEEESAAAGGGGDKGDSVADASTHDGDKKRKGAAGDKDGAGTEVPGPRKGHGGRKEGGPSRPPPPQVHTTSQLEWEVVAMFGAEREGDPPTREVDKDPAPPSPNEAGGKGKTPPKRPGVSGTTKAAAPENAAPGGMPTPSGDASPPEGSKPAVAEDLDSPDVAGRRLAVYWPGDRAWYPGAAVSASARRRTVRVLYDDGFDEPVSLTKTAVVWLP
eukprot:jgi/Mesvir1/4801/Mv11094-RA.1